ncbi:MAG: hypothetical protein AB4911_05880 [Oscillochloridaceae bacterium umkhey_bin13]
MSTSSREPTITIGRQELEALLRRIVREELQHLLEQQRATGLAELEDPDDLAGDAELLTEVLAQRDMEHQTTPTRMTWAEAKAELARAEPLSF